MDLDFDSTLFGEFDFDFEEFARQFGMGDTVADVPLTLQEEDPFAFDLTDQTADVSQLHPTQADAAPRAPQQQQQQAVASPEPAPAPLPLSASMAAPNMVPDQCMGAYFHPSIGWYFPALQAPDITIPNNSLPPTTAGPLSLVQEGFTAKPPTPPYKGKGKSKQQYGPAAYLGSQGESSQGILLPQSVKASQNIYPGKPAVQTPHPLRDIKTATIVQACVCTDKEANKVKRPKNAFILYRSAHSHAILSEAKGRGNVDVSVIAAARWNSETAENRQKFFDLAEAEKARHRALHPDWQYKPGVSARNKFGSASCRCGAFKANMAAFLAANGGGNADEKNQDHRIPARRGAPRAPPASTAPIAPMTHPSSVATKPQQAPLPDPYTFGFTTASQRAEAFAHVAELKRKREADGQEPEEPLAKRRSPRLGRKSITYIEPDEDDIFQLTTLNDPSPSPPHVPNATDDGASQGHSEDAPGSDDDDVIVVASRYNTRGNSFKGRTASRPRESVWPGIDWDAFPNADFEETFMKCFNSGGNATDARRRSSRTQSQESQAPPALSTRSRSRPDIEAVSPTSRYPSRKSSKKSSW